MLKSYHGAQEVPAGIYLSMSTGSYVQFNSTSTLPGDDTARYVRLNVLATLLLGPLSGLLFILALPLLAPVFVVWATVKAIGRHAAPAPTEPQLAPQRRR